MKERTEECCVVLPSNQETAIVADPSDGTLDLPSTTVPTKRTPVLMDPLSGRQVRGNQLDPVFLEPLAEGERIVALVRDESGWILARPARALTVNEAKPRAPRAGGGGGGGGGGRDRW